MKNKWECRENKRRSPGGWRPLYLTVLFCQPGWSAGPGGQDFASSSVTCRDLIGRTYPEPAERCFECVPAGRLWPTPPPRPPTAGTRIVPMRRRNLSTTFWRCPKAPTSTALSAMGLTRLEPTANPNSMSCPRRKTPKWSKWRRNGR